MNDEEKEMRAMQARLEVYKGMVECGADTYVSKDWAMKNILNIDMEAEKKREDRNRKIDDLLDDE